VQPIGRQPTWVPQTAGDRAGVVAFGVLYVILYAPLHILHRLLGWTRVPWLALDLLSLPGRLYMVVVSPFGPRAKAHGQKANALAHTELVCRLCPAARQATRDPAGGTACAWNRAWNAGQFGIPPDFGTRNYFRQFAGRTDLAAYRGLGKDLPPAPKRRVAGPALAWTLSLAFWAMAIAGLVLLVG
jgi:hypothetical protein